MDVCADQLMASLPQVSGLRATDVEAPFHRLAARLPVIGRFNTAFNADRVFYRHVTMPRFVRKRVDSLGYVHVVDHSYAHAALVVPAGRCGVYCHDLDAFRSVLQQGDEARPWWYRSLAQRTLKGLRAAAVVFHSTDTVRDSILQHGLVEPSRLVHAPYGVEAAFRPDHFAPVDLPPLPPSPFALHVGSHLPRKRIDVLLDAFAEASKLRPDLSLVQVGPPFTPALAGRVDRLKVGARVISHSNLTRTQLAELYRRAAVVLVPSESEGFGLPVVEALACGAVVVASDIPVLREVGGRAILYRPVGDVLAWADAVLRVLAAEPGAVPPRAVRLAHSEKYSWLEHARVIGKTYLRLASGGA